MKKITVTVPDSQIDDAARATIKRLERKVASLEKKVREKDRWIAERKSEAKVLARIKGELEAAAVDLGMWFE